jgi:hypothetical protein
MHRVFKCCANEIASVTVSLYFYREATPLTQLLGGTGFSNEQLESMNRQTVLQLQIQLTLSLVGVLVLIGTIVACVRRNRIQKAAIEEATARYNHDLSQMQYHATSSAPLPSSSGTYTGYPVAQPVRMELQTFRNSSAQAGGSDEHEKLLPTPHSGYQALASAEALPSHSGGAKA